jgi:tripartite ATP-independent transporter DctP family solute receptor
MRLGLLKTMKITVVGLTMSMAVVGCSSKSPQADKTTEQTQGGETTATVPETSAPQKAEFVFKLGHAADENNTWHKGVIKFAEEVKEKSSGRIEIQVYPNEQLGKEIDNVTAIQGGTADMVLSGESLQNWAPRVGIMSTPYLIRDSEHMKKVIDGEPGKILAQDISEQVGLHILTFFERGPRTLTSNKPINSIADIQGLKVRIPNVPLFVDVWNNWGAKPTPMAFTEIFTSLQQNTIEAQENPLALMNSGGFYEVQKYVNNTQHVRGWIYMLIGNDQWNTLPDDLKQIMTDAAQVAQQYEHELFLEGEEAIKKSLLEEKGMEWIETDITEMKAKAEEYYESNLDPQLLELYNMINDIQ